MNNEERVQVLLFLTQNIDVFAWNPYEVPGVDPGFIIHKLNVDPTYPPKKQKPRRSAKDHVEAIRQEVEKLKEAGAIKETFFPGVAGKHRGCQEEERKMEGLCGFHGLESSMSKGSVLHAED